MSKIRYVWILLSLAFLQVVTSPLFAQAAEAAEEEEAGKSWVLNYIFTGLLVALGVMVVGHGSGREIEEARKNELKEAKEKEERLKKLENK